MGLYQRYLMPRIVHLACGQKPTMRQRGRIVPEATGRVLELGIGSGLNLPFYNPARVTHLWGLDPSPQMWALAERDRDARAVEVEFLQAPAEAIPLDDDSIDTVVVTYSLCTIPDTAAALSEARRVLRPDGRLLFCEHGEAPDAGVRRWQRRINPLWKRLGGGCHLDRPIPGLIRTAGFRIDRLESMYIPGWKPASFNYWGSATPG